VRATARLSRIVALEAMSTTDGLAGGGALWGSQPASQSAVRVVEPEVLAAALAQQASEYAQAAIAHEERCEKVSATHCSR
jgi:hypothetical protein